MLDGIPFSEVREFVKKGRQTGRYKASSAKNLLAAIAIVEELLEPGHDSVGYVDAHVSDLFERHQNLNPGVGHNSLIAYRSRLSRALKDFIAHRTGRALKAGEKVPEARKGSTRAAARPRAEETRADVALDALLHRFPLRPGFDVQVLLPRDFSAREARRVTQWIAAFAVGDDDK